jgi:putative transposase
MEELAMANVHNEVYLHLVWGTQSRRPLLTVERREIVFKEIVRKATERRCSLLAVNGVTDHVHVLLHLATSTSIGDLVHDLKGASAWAANQGEAKGFSWQGGYGVFPITPQALPKVIAYIENQEIHHREETTNALLELK